MDTPPRPCCASDAGKAEFAAFLDALHRRRVLLIREVPNDPAAQVAFSRRMGPLELHSHATATHSRHPEIFRVGNYKAEGIGANFARGLEQWHADSSIRETPSAASLFYGAICPPEGGETCFLDAAATFAELDPAMPARIGGLRAVHDLATLSAWNAGTILAAWARRRRRGGASRRSPSRWCGCIRRPG